MRLQLVALAGALLCAGAHAAEPVLLECKTTDGHRWWDLLVDPQKRTLGTMYTGSAKPDRSYDYTEMPRRIVASDRPGGAPYEEIVVDRFTFAFEYHRAKRGDEAPLDLTGTCTPKPRGF